MQLKRIKVENFKKLKDVSSNIDGNIIYVKGGNEKGKTTFTNAVISLLKAKLDVDNPVSTGEDEGSIEGVFEAPNGEKYTVKIEFENDKSKVKIAFPNGKISRKVTEIRDIFNYNSFSPEEFVAKSKTAEGRRWQRDQVLKLLPDEAQESFTKAMEEEKKAFDQRRELKREADAYEKILSKEKPSEEEKQAIQDYDEITKDLGKNEEYYQDLKERKDTRNEFFVMKERLESRFTDKKREVESSVNSIQEQIEFLQKKKLEKENELTNIKDKYNAKKQEIDEGIEKIPFVEEEKLDQVKRFSETLRDKLRKIGEAKQRIENYQKKSSELDSYKKKIQTEETKLSSAREEKERLVQNNKLPVDGLEITDDGLLIDSLPFNENQISTSKIMEVAISVLIEMNKKAPIIVVGRAESLDPESLEKVVEQASKNNCQIFIDKVESGEFELEIEERVNYQPKPKEEYVKAVEAPKPEKEKKLPDFSEQLNQMESRDTGNEGDSDDFSDFQF